MINKVDRFTVELGSEFDLSSNPIVCINGVKQEFTNKTLTTVTPGNTVSLLDFTKEVPEGMTKFLKYTMDNKALGIFFDSNDNAYPVAYLVRPSENWISITSWAPSPHA